MQYDRISQQQLSFLCDFIGKYLQNVKKDIISRKTALQTTITSSHAFLTWWTWPTNGEQ